MKTFSVYLGIGSNVGDRHNFLNMAVAELKKNPDVKLVWASSIYETDPYGKKDQAKFLNAVLEIETSLTPAELLEEVKRVERILGRSSTEHWGPCRNL